MPSDSHDKKSPTSRRAHRIVQFVALALLCTGLGTGVACGVSERELSDRIDRLEAREEVRAIVLEFAQIVDSAEPEQLASLTAKLDPSFVLEVVDIAGREQRFQGFQGLLEGYGPIMAAARSNLATSAIMVDVRGERAIAWFKLINSVEPPPQLGLGVDDKVLLFSANTASFERRDGHWRMVSLRLEHSLAYPGLGGLEHLDGDTIEVAK